MYEVRRLRQEKGWNQNELAFHADLAPSVISQIETGKREPSATTLRKLAEALDVEIPDLFEKPDSPKAPAPSPEILEVEDWERRRLKIKGLTIVATKLRTKWTEELQQGGLAEYRAMEISLAIKGVLRDAESRAILGGLDHTDKANAKQAKRLREELERLVELHKLAVEQSITGLEFELIVDGVEFEQVSASPVKTVKESHA